MVVSDGGCWISIKEVIARLSISGEDPDEILLLDTSYSLKEIKQKLNMEIYNSYVRGSKITYLPI